MTIDKILTDEQIDKLNETQLKEYISKYNKEIARRLVEIQTQLEEEDKELARIGTDFFEGDRLAKSGIRRRSK